MALIECGECDKQISDKAEACPNCGISLTPKLVHIEFTAKNLKWQKAVSKWGAGVSFMGIFFASAVQSDVLGSVSGIFFFGFLIWYGVTLGRVWWKHG